MMISLFVHCSILIAASNAFSLRSPTNARFGGLRSSVKMLTVQDEVVTINTPTVFTCMVVS